jgi:hypothetical protein
MSTKAIGLNGKPKYDRLSSDLWELFFASWVGVEREICCSGRIKK